MVGAAKTPFGEGAREARGSHLLLIGLVPVVLVGVFLLPQSVREQLVLESTDPTLVAAYTAYFVHIQEFHLVGNLLMYALVVPLTYLLAVLGGRRRLFVNAFLTFLLAFPFALTVFQLIFPRERLLFGFSGINAAFFGLLCFVVVSYAGRVVPSPLTEREAPALLFGTLAIVALVSLPSRAYPLEIALVSGILATVYVFSAVMNEGLPSFEQVRVETKRGGYVELGCIGLGVLVLFPFLAFQTVFVGDGTVYDVYVHLVGYCLGFLVVYVSAVTDPRVDFSSISDNLSE